MNIDEVHLCSYFKAWMNADTPTLKNLDVVFKPQLNKHDMTTEEEEAKRDVFILWSYRWNSELTKLPEWIAEAIIYIQNNESQISLLK